METIFLNTENCKTNETNAFTSLILKIHIKILHWLISVFIAHGKILNLHITTINLKYLLQLGTISLI